MDDWTLYQITGEPVYIQRFRRDRALLAAVMGGSLSGIGVVSSAIMIKRLQSRAPLHAIGATIVGGAVCGGISMWNSRELVGDFMMPASGPDALQDTEMKGHRGPSESARTV
uniref:Uncharacterized protein n=1 Tax=Noctiluca scintillans TaxID=2966 RepID=A0A7S1FI88_NOCSC